MSVQFLLQLAVDMPASTNPDDPAPTAGMYLARFDPEFEDGLGAAWWTERQAAALHFPDSISALDTWRRQSVTRPVRPDGKPNRPLTAVTITVVRADDASCLDAAGAERMSALVASEVERHHRRSARLLEHPYELDAYDDGHSPSSRELARSVANMRQSARLLLPPDGDLAAETALWRERLADLVAAFWAPVDAVWTERTAPFRRPR